MFVNVDVSTYVHPFLDRICEKNYFYDEMLYPFVDQYADTEVTDLLFNIFCQYSATDSMVMGTYEEKYFQTFEEGQMVDYKDTFKSLYKMNCIYGKDPFGIWINRCRQVGIRPWLSIRMNDAHNNGDAPFVGRTHVYYEAKEKGWLLGSEYGYYGYNLNYGIKEVRDRMLSYVEEQLDRYDVDGIELDFLREIICFRYHTENMADCIAVMNGFMEEVRSIVTKCEAKKGHKILLAVRCMRDYKQSLRYGFDPTSWNVDILIPSPRWASSDSGIAVGEWKSLCPRVKIIPCIETLLAVEPDHTGVMSAEVVRGHAASFMAQGADDIYLYNYFSDPDAKYSPCGERSGHSSFRNHIIYNTLDRYPKRFAIVGQSSEHYPDQYPTWRPFPCNEGEFKIVTGSIEKDKTTDLIVGVEGNIDKADVRINGMTVRDWSMTDLEYIPGIGAQPSGYTNADTVCYRCRVDLGDNPIQQISLKGIKFNWLEIAVF